MKSIIFVKLALLSFIVISPVTLPSPVGSSILGEFVATSPCDAVSRALLQIPKPGDCEVIKWRLTLYQDSSTLTPTTYKLGYAYGLPEQGTNGLAQGGTKVVREGKWTMVRGAKTNPDMVIYQLDPDKPQASVSLQIVDHNLLHLLDRDEKLMIGNAGWSYTLNGIGDFGRLRQPTRPPATARAQAGSPTASPLPLTKDPSILGRFVGRSPCRDVARELNRAVNAECMKLKWDLTLYQDPNTLIPTTYKLNGTFYRVRIGEGKWAIIKGTKTNPDAIVYQLDPDKSHGSLFFLKTDDNILFFLSKERNPMVGNGDFSYTLNKANNALKN